MKVGKAKRLFVRVTFSDNGALKELIRSPFQKGAYRKIKILALDSNGDGVPDQIWVTAKKGKKTVRRLVAM